MEKRARERAVKERRELKAEKKRARKLAAAAETAPESGFAEADEEQAPPGEDDAVNT